MRFDRSGKNVHRNPHVFEQAVNFNGVVAGKGGISSPIWRAAPNPYLCDPDYCHFVFDDFNDLITLHDGWTTFGTGDTTAPTDAAGGVLSMATAATDNDAAGITSTNEVFALHALKPIYFEAKVKVAEVDTDKINVYVGLHEGAAADEVPFGTNGGTPTDDDAIGFFKIDGGTTWNAESADGAAAYETTALAARDTNWVRLGFIADTTHIRFYRDGGLVATHVTTFPTVDEELHITIGCQAGSAAAETLLCDWIRVVQLR